MTASYPTSVWDGSSLNQEINTNAAPDYRDWKRLIEEVAAAQTRVDSNLVGADDDTVDSVGAVAAVTGLTVVEKGDGAVHKTILTLVDVDLTITDGITPGTDGAWGTLKLYTLPVGRALFLGGHAQFPLGKLEATTGGGTGLSDTSDFGIGVGTVASAQATAFGLATTQENLATEMDVDLTSGTSDAIEAAAVCTKVEHDGTTTAATVNLNMRTLDDGDCGAAGDVLIVSGTITIVWTMLGDD